MTRLAELATAALAGQPGTGPAPASGTGAARGLAAVETAFRSAMTTLGASLLEQVLGLDAGRRGPRVDCGAGHQAGFVDYRVKTVDTVLGAIELRRAYYHCDQCHHGVVPRDTQLEVTGASLSPGLRAMLDRAGAAVPFAQARSLLTELAGITLTTKRVERAAEADGLSAAAEADTRTWAILTGQITPMRPPAPAAGRGLDILYSAIDGTGVPMTAAQTAGRAGKGPDGRAGTREAKLAAVFTQTKTTDDGYPIRDPDSTSYVATLDPVEHFADLYQAEARARGADHMRQLVILGDGARWIWNLATNRFPEATQIVDLYHAREHLHELADLLAFILPDRDTWLTDRLTELDDGDIEALAAAAAGIYDLSGPKADDLNTAIGYFTRNTQRMRYAYFRSLGMFVGSGVVEAGCKAVIGARLKRSGMHWTTRGATGIITLRCAHASRPSADTSAA